MIKSMIAHKELLEKVETLLGELDVFEGMEKPFTEKNNYDNYGNLIVQVNRGVEWVVWTLYKDGGYRGFANGYYTTDWMALQSEYSRRVNA